MRKKLIWLLSLLLSSTLLLTACGGAADEAQQAAESAVDEVQEEAEEAVEEAQTVVEEALAEDPLGSITIAPGDPIRLATALVIAGPNETLGLDSQYGVEVALQEQGELLGHPLELVAEDGGCSAEGGQTAATKIASDDSIVAVVGHNCSSSCTPAGPIYTDAGLTMISPSCTAPALTGAGHVASFLRTAHNDNVQGRVMAEFVYNELGLRSAATIHDGSPYAEQLQQVFADVFVELGGEITAQEAINVGDTDMRPVLTSIATGGPEFLYYPIFIAEGSFVTTQAKEIAGLEDVVLAGADGMISPDFLATAGEAAEGMYISGPDLAFSGQRYEDFKRAYRELSGQDLLSAFHAHAYDAANMILAAIGQVGQMDDEGNLVIGRQALREALYATRGFDGITGSLSCAENGDCADPKIAVNQIQAGAYVPVYQGGEILDDMAAGEAMEEPTDDLLAEIQERGTIRVSTDPNYAPQSFLGSDGSFQGFDVDVATEIASRLGVEVEFVTPDWDIITAGNWGDQWDMSVGSMTVTTARQQALDFASPAYYYTPAQFAAAEGSGIESLDDVAGQAVCVGISTTYETWLNGNLEDLGLPEESFFAEVPADVTAFPLQTDNECAQSIQAGRDEFSIFLTSNTVVEAAINAGAPIYKVGTPVFSENLAVAFDKSASKDNTRLVQAVSDTIAEMHADGTLSNLSMQWFEEDLTEDPTK